MQIPILKAIRHFVDWFHKIKPIKKIYALMMLIAIAFIFLLQYYESQINTINTNHNNRVDSITRFFNYRLEKCNSENKEEYTRLIQILNDNLEAQKNLQNEAEKIKLESERLKLRLIK